MMSEPESMNSHHKFPGKAPFTFRKSPEHESTIFVKIFRIFLVTFGHIRTERAGKTLKIYDRNTTLMFR